MKTDAIIIAGYLGAGKTTLINKALKEGQGLRSLVLVNDFGSINIDASLIAQSTDNIISLVNGCACCQIGDDLTQTLNAIIDKLDDFDRVILEASGVADLGNLRRHFEGMAKHFRLQELMVVDGSRLNELLSDKFVGQHIRAQIACAQNVLLAKLELLNSGKRKQLMKTLNALNNEVVVVDGLDALRNTLIPIETGIRSDSQNHLRFHSRVIEGDGPLDTKKLEVWLARLPGSIHRIKGYIETEAGWVLLQYVSGHSEMISVDARSVPQTFINKLSVVSAVEELSEGKLGSPWE